MRLVVAVLVGVAAELAGIGLMTTAVWLVMRAAEQPPMSALTVAIVAVRTLALARGGLRYAERLAGHGAVLRAMVEVRGRVYESLVRRPLRDGDALTRLVSDVDAVQDAVLRCLLPACVAGLVGVTAVVVVPSLAVGVVVVGVVLPLVAFVLADRHLRALAPLRAVLAERTVTLREGAAELRAFGALEGELARTDAVVDELAVRERRGAFPAAVLAGVAVVVQFGVAVVLLVQASPAHVVLGSVAVLEVMVPLTGAAQKWAEVRGSVARVREVLGAQGKSFDREPLVDVTGYRRIGVVGPSGAGKSTLLRVIAEKHGAKGVLDDAHVFERTVRENVLFAKPGATQAELDRVAAIADLDVDWDAEAKLSGGQRQRLFLARALLADPDILLLDEPVEGLAIRHGDEVLSRVLDAARGTVVLVTHRLAPLQDFDHVVVVEDGQVTQRGTHDELASVPGYYRDRWISEHIGDRSVMPTVH
ncbi:MULTISPECIES: amino acid ABC transporter ATP-binding/permease protein [unclassified Saccharothrix]|uniref:amino acid ABC transporter ATP-binding/permease protein n=1 Tax=unclassified Saccharothrix TaxID=2593673 RepID=UPI00307ED573